MSVGRKKRRTKSHCKLTSTHFLALFVYYDTTMNIEVAVASYVCDGVVLFASLPRRRESDLLA